MSDENVADVVSLMTGIPVNKVASQERKKLVSMTDNIKAIESSNINQLKGHIKSARAARARVEVCISKSSIGKFQIATFGKMKKIKFSDCNFESQISTDKRRHHSAPPQCHHHHTVPMPRCHHIITRRCPLPQCTSSTTSTRFPCPHTDLIF